MSYDLSQESFKVWASDHMVYGPVDLNTLIQWVREARIFPQTWVLAQNQNRWCQAETIQPLREEFGQEGSSALTPPVTPAGAAAAPEELRQFALFSGLSNEQIQRFVQFGELVRVRQGHVILKRNDPGDSVFFVLSGSVRVRIIIGLEDKNLGRVPAGECFGEVAMLTGAPRSADVVAEVDVRLLRMTMEAFHLLMSDEPQLASPILLGMAQMLASRLAGRTQEYAREVASEFLWR